MGSAGLVAWIFYQVDMQQLMVTIQSAHYPLVIFAAFAILSTIVFRAWRWQYLLQPVKPVCLLSLLSATSIGFMVNMLLPAHAGELARAYVIGHKENMTTMSSFATIVVERVVDLLSLLLLILAMLALASLSPSMLPIVSGLRTGGLIICLICLGMVAGLWLVKYRTAQTVAWLGRWMQCLPDKWRTSACAALWSFAEGLKAFKQGRHMVSVILISLLIWTVLALSNSLIFSAFDLQLPWPAAFFILFAQVIGVMIPSSPGFIGTYHASVVSGLALFSIPPELALSVAIAMHAAFFFPCIVIGLVFLWFENLTLHQLRTSMQH